MIFKLKADPTFKAKVPIPVPGQPPQEVEFEFRHRTASQMKEFVEDESIQTLDNVAFVKQLAVGWSGVDGEFGDESLAAMFDNFPGAPAAIRDVYLREVMGARVGNSG